MLPTLWKRLALVLLRLESLLLLVNRLGRLWIAVLIELMSTVGAEDDAGGNLLSALRAVHKYR